MDTLAKIEEWLTVNTLEEILEQNDLEPEDALMVLFRQGLIDIPPWLDGIGVDYFGEDDGP